MASFLCSNLPKDDLIFEEIVPTLENIAAFNIALPIWYNSLHQVTSNDNDKLIGVVETFTLKREAERHIERLNIPKRIEDLINESLTMIMYKIFLWTDETCHDVFDVENLYGRRSHMKCLFWKPNLEIDYEKTARKILSHPDWFTQAEKFQLMCQFCWKEEIEALVPDVELQQFIEKIYSKPELFVEFPAMYYWICYLKNTLHHGIIPFEPDYRSVERFMLSEGVLRSLASVEYFWNFIPEEDQETVAIDLLKKNEKMKSHQKSILSKLSKLQKHAVLSKIPHCIISNFINSSMEDARYVWTRVENSITDDEFVVLMKNILRRIPECECCRRHFAVMAELFKAASNQHKNYCLYGRSDVIDLFFDRESQIPRDACLPLLSAILTHASPTYRRDIILERGDVLFDDYYPCKKVMKLIEFCLPNSNDIAEFKIRVQESIFVKERYAELFHRGCFAALTRYLESYFPKEPILKNIMKQIIDENDLKFDSSIFEDREWDEMTKLLNIVYNDDVVVVNNVTKKLVPSFKWPGDFQSDFENLEL